MPLLRHFMTATAMIFGAIVSRAAAYEGLYYATMTRESRTEFVEHRVEPYPDVVLEECAADDPDQISPGSAKKFRTKGMTPRQTIRLPEMQVRPVYVGQETFGPDFVQRFFSPAHELDRRLRPDAWSWPVDSSP